MSLFQFLGIRSLPSYCVGTGNFFSLADVAKLKKLSSLEQFGFGILHLHDFIVGLSEEFTKV